MGSYNNILIITHAGHSIGGGHVSRCFALAEAFTSLGTPLPLRWIVNSEAHAILRGKGVQKNSLTVVEKPFGNGADAVLSTVSRLSPDLCIVDSYNASQAFLAELRRYSHVALLDDCRVRPVERECDILLNYNLNARLLGYETGQGKLLLGPKYTLLRREFWDLKPEKGNFILIIPGASDILNTGEQFLKWWQKDWPGAELVLGPLVERSKAMRLAGTALNSPNLSVAYNPPDLPSRIAKARSVICTSSVTSYEALALGKPIGVFQTAENQVGIGMEIERLGLGQNLGFWGTWDEFALKSALQYLVAEQPRTNPVNPRGAESAARKISTLLTQK
jgi:spore coat polysaccharide biosynthesis predicted glycosyltransferase SpsG